MNSIRSDQARGAIRPAASITFGIVAASLAVVAIIAFAGGGGLGRGNDDGGVVIPPGSPSPVPVPSPKPTPEASDGGGDAMPIKVDLDNATGADVYVDVVDYTESISGAISGKPGDGASAAPYTLAMDVVDARTLKLTWVDYPIDNALTLYIYRTDGGGYRLVLIQPEPTGETDAMAFDRELILTFEEPVPANQIELSLQNGIDTPG